LRGGALPAALLCGALGLAVGFAPRRAWAPSVIALTASATAVAMAPVPPDWTEGVFLGCWTSVAVSAATVHLPRAPGLLKVLALSLNAGFWCGAVITLTGSWHDLLKALPCVLVVFPAAWLIRQRAAIAVKVVSSWLIAVAVLAAMLQFLPVTPGYLPDHID
jgi:hypothetical protein